MLEGENRRAIPQTRPQPPYARAGTLGAVRGDVSAHPGVSYCYVRADVLCRGANFSGRRTRHALGPSCEHLLRPLGVVAPASNDGLLAHRRYGSSGERGDTGGTPCLCLQPHQLRRDSVLFGGARTELRDEKNVSPLPQASSRLAVVQGVGFLLLNPELRPYARRKLLVAYFVISVATLRTRLD